MAAYYSERYEFFLGLREQLKKDNLKFKYYIYLPFVYYAKLLLLGKAPKKADIRFFPLDRKQYQMWLMNTNIVIDYTLSSQSGLPMRIIEALGAGKKIATNNPHVAAMNNPLIRNYPVDFKSFLKEDIAPQGQTQSYRMDTWLQHVFS